VIQRGVVSFSVCLGLAFLAACSGAQPAAVLGDSGTPTLSAYFAAPTNKADIATQPNGVDAGASVPTLSSYFVTLAPLPTRTPRLTPTPFPTRVPVTESPEDEATQTGETNSAAANLDDFTLVDIYNDALMPGWSADDSWGVEFDLQSKDTAHSGEFSIAVTPQEDFGALMLAVLQDSPQTYPYTQTVGVRFWLNAGETPLYLDQLAAAVIGSNQYPYWQQGDTSTADSGQTGSFSETRLYFLGFNRELPPQEWLEVVIWLDDLTYDPEYTWVTAIYFKNDAGFRDTYYVDDVALVQIEADALTPTP